jgi:hypothetical protein
MVRRVKTSIPAAPLIHSQLILPKRDAHLPPLPDESDGLWVRVNRICDQYMPQLFDANALHMSRDNFTK